MKTVDQTLEQLGNTLDTVGELLRQLPLDENRRIELTSRVYDLWAEVEHDLRTVDFDEEE